MKRLISKQKRRFGAGKAKQQPWWHPSRFKNPIARHVLKGDLVLHVSDKMLNHARQVLLREGRRKKVKDALSLTLLRLYGYAHYKIHRGVRFRIRLYRDCKVNVAASNAASADYRKYPSFAKLINKLACDRVHKRRSNHQTTEAPLHKVHTSEL